MTQRTASSPSRSGELGRHCCLRAQAAELCQVSEEILDQWSYEPGFPVIRRNGGHFVRIHRAALERWLEQFALGTSPHSPYSDAPPTLAVRRRVRR